ncbi:Carbohydrate binding module (family 6) [Fibrobacter sp. UWB16]|uniref:sialate O-acetylesterase n=1 Tax=Fibrobacter sp. UWB16 TaxID=1945874 RepID=UPI000BD3565E|nr:sialate O-acetylesterase [Fibrobacter sp. UWB16]SOD15993.1 Carbohydrate binding module (family 6) [Fibrobacter sp. UWB16]
MSVEMSFKKLMGIAGVAAGLSMFAVTGANAAPDPNFHIYIAYGQSNMEGNATNFDKNIDGKEHPRVKMFATTSCSNLGRPTVGEMYPAVPPMFKCNQGLSVADWFGRHMADSLPNVTIGIIPVAQGGTSIRLFDPDDYKNYLNSAESWLKNGAKAYGNDGNAMGRIIEVAKKAQEKGVIKGIIFHQGETDGGMSNWEQIVKKTYEYMLKQLGLKAEETPFVAGEMVDGGSCAGFSSRVRGLSKYIANFGVASSKGYGSKGDGLHFTVQGYRGMGERYAQEMLKLINVAPVDPVPQEPFKGKAIAIPGKIEVEDFDKPGIGKNEDGTSNASFSDEDSENHGDSDYRKDTGVDLYKTADGVALGYTQTGEWLEYTVEVKADGDYSIEASVAAGNSTSAFKLYIDEKSITDEVSVPQTADNKWDTYKMIDVKEKVALKAGKHVLKLEITANYANIDWIQFSQLGEVPPYEGIAKVRLDMTEAESNFSVYSMQGQKLGTFTAKGMADAVNLVKTDAKLRKQAKGVFFVRKEGAKLMSKKVVVFE